MPPAALANDIVGDVVIPEKASLVLKAATSAYVVPKKDSVLPEFGVDKRDVGTKDDWVPRHPELVRLTGRHPFNCEAPLPRLRDSGFITPVSLHYVRNHGAVPKADWDSWTVTVSGLVEKPTTFTMADILAMPARTIPITMVCAGNRRKEQNMVKQTIGFNWGAAGVSTSIWKGVLLADVLKKCGIKSHAEGAKFVSFEGAETLPGGGGSKYATSITAAYSMEAPNDVLLAYEQNGEKLTPDHGYPIRTVIPGHIGGRTIKWLTKIEVREKEDDSYYHYRDNRVLPPHVDAELATAEGWWYNPDYIINQLNVQSAMWKPENAEVLKLTGASQKYTFSGYAYSGGGRKITRVELTLDDGKTWLHCKLEHPEEPTEHGRYWCWCFWSVEIDVFQLLTCKEVAVRAMDSSMNLQPEKLTWNVMGMMNNCWFRVKIHPCALPGGGMGLQFEHPTMPGNEKGGWMVKQEEAPPAAPPPVPKVVTEGKVTPASNELILTMDEVQKHDDEKDCWIVIDNKVYDATRFLDDHPGGGESILINAGTDCSEEFNAIHSSKAKAMLADYYIGDLGGKHLVPPSNGVTAPSQALPEPLHTDPQTLIALNPKMRIPFRLIKKESLSHNVRRFRFALQSPEHVLGLPIGKHIFLSATVNGQFVMRAYTPTTCDEHPGYFDLVIKVYFKNIHPRFPDGGVLSQHLDTLKIGDTIDVKGPVGHIVYEGKGAMTANKKPFAFKKVTLIAGGTGITPVYQIITAVLRNPEDKTQMSLLYANQSPDDILLRDELEDLAKKHPEQLKIWYTVDRAPNGDEWPYSVGFITEDMMRERLFPSGEDTVAMMCGPPPMINSCIAKLENMGYDKEKCFAF